MSTADLFPDAPSAPYQAHSETSRRAAERIAPIAHTKRGLVLAYIAACGEMGATDEEMQLRLPMSPNTQRPRRVELVQDGMVKDSGRTRPTLGGDFATVWVVA